MFLFASRAQFGERLAFGRGRRESCESASGVARGSTSAPRRAQARRPCRSRAPTASRAARRNPFRCGGPGNAVGHYSPTSALYSVVAEQLGKLGEGHLDEPALAERVAVHQLGGRHDGVVDLEHGAVDGGEQLADRLGRLDLADDACPRRRSSRPSGRSTKTTSPSLSAAYAVMPTVAMSPSTSDPLVLLGVFEVCRVRS